MRHTLVTLVIALFGAQGASAQTLADVSAAEERPWSVQAGMGFTADPDAFLLDFEGDYRVGGGFSLGASVQLGLDDDFTLVSPTGYLRYSFDLTKMGASESLRSLRPFIQAGAGFAYINLDVPAFANVDEDDIGFLANTGFGIDYGITRHLALGSRMLFNFIPVDVFGENFYYSWEVATLRYRF